MMRKDTKRLIIIPLSKFQLSIIPLAAVRYSHLYLHLESENIELFEVFVHINTYGCKRAGTRPSLGLGESLLIDISTLLGSGEVALHLAELGQVEGSDLLGLLNLFLVGLDLALELIDEALHPLMVLSVFILLVSELLDVPLRLPQVL